MSIPIAPNVAVGSVADALRLAIPTMRLASRRNLRRLQRADTHAARDTWLRLWSERVLTALDVDLHIEGADRVEIEQPHIVLPLHESLIDVPLLISNVALAMTFVAREELTNEEPFAGMLEASHQILIDPESRSSLGKVKRATALLHAQGRSVVMFPQGSVLGIETGFQRGACVVAEDLALPVLPVVIAGSHRVWERPFSPLVRRSQPVYVEIMAPRRLDSPSSYRQLEQEMKTRALDNGWAAPRRFVPERDGYWDGYRFEIDADYPTLVEQIRLRRAGRASMETTVEPSP